MVKKKVQKSPTKSVKKAKTITKKPVKKTIKAKSKVVKTTKKVVKKTKPSSKKSSIKAKVIKKKIKASPKQVDHSALLEDSFNLIKKLNTQVSSVEKVKKKLQEDVSHLGERLEKHEKTKPSISNSKLVMSLKEEIIKDIDPLLQKIHVKSMRVDMFKEIEKIIEIELQKLKSQMDSSSSKQKRDATKKFAELEMRLIETLKGQKTLQKQLGGVEESFDQLRDITQKDLKEDAIDLSTFENQINRLAKDNKSLHSLLEKYENELYSRTQVEELDIEKKVQKTLAAATRKLNEVKREQSGEEQFLVDKINEIISYIEKFENQVKTAQKTHKINTDKKLKENYTSLRKTLVDKLTLAFKEKFAKTNSYLQSSINKFNDDKENIERNLDIFKSEISSLVRNYVSEIDKELKKIQSKEKTYVVEKDNLLKEIDSKVAATLDGIEKEKNIERNFLRDKLNEIIDVFNNLSVEQKKELNKLEKANKENILKTFNSESQKAQEELASQLIKNNQYLNQISTSSKEEERKLREDIEKKFLNTKEQYEAAFASHLQSFDTELKGKESEFLTKLMAIEEEKTHMISELHTFKKDMASLTKTYILKYDEELAKIQASEANFEEDKKAFEAEIDNLTQVRKIEITEHAKQLELDSSSLLEDERVRFERNEDSFREVFKEKIENLHEYTKHRLDSLDKKFVEKNVKSIRDRIDVDLKEVLTLASQVQSKEEELNKKLDAQDSKEEQMYANLVAEKDELNKKVETRLVELEQQLNKRFLEIDSDFSTFKGTVIEEVESLMKEVNDLVQDKVEVVEKLTTKLNFIGQEAIEKTKGMIGVDLDMEGTISSLRNEINDLRVKTDVQSNPEIRNMNLLVGQMSEYESQLISLIESLSARDVSHASIVNILVQKGHPQFYVRMIVDSLHKIKR